MSILEALFLGILQGLTEFFPISSSTHLEMARRLFGLKGDLSFDLFCHLGTLLALCLFWRREIYLFFKEKRNLLFIFFALIPLIPCYFLFSPFQAGLDPLLLCGPLMIFSAIVLFLSQNLRISEEATTPFAKVKQVFLIGCAQSAALFPGISRSGMTIATAKMLGWTAESAVRFSFLLSIPTILGGIFIHSLKITPSFSLSCVTGFFSSFVVGYAVIGFAMNLLKKGHLKPFAWYCLVFGIMMIYYSYAKG